METTTDSILKSNILINQPKNGFRFSVDSILLSRFVVKKNFNNVLDIGSGSGIISVLMAKLYGFKKIDAVELQPLMFNCLVKTIELNSLTNTINPINTDIKHFKPNKKYDMIISNPPYRNKNSGKNCNTKSENIARFDEEMNLEDICKFANSYLENLGYFYFSYDADLAIKAFKICTSYNLEPKRIKLLHPDINKPAKLIFAECRKNGKTELKIESPVFQRINGKENEDFSNILIIN